jgi:hypothetical protein
MAGAASRWHFLLLGPPTQQGKQEIGKQPSSLLGPSGAEDAASRPEQDVDFPDTDDAITVRSKCPHILGGFLPQPDARSREGACV